MDYGLKTKMACLLPVIRWQGWRLPFLDYGSEERGGHVLLLLDREGDLALLPCAQIGYIYYAPEEAEEWACLEPLRITNADALTRSMLEDTLAALQADGWRVVGRLETLFVGAETELDFWQRLEAELADERQ